MEVIVTREMLLTARLLGACEDLPKIGDPISSVPQSQLFWVHQRAQYFALPQIPNPLGVLPAWVLAGVGYGYGDGVGYGYGYGYGDGYGDGVGVKLLGLDR